MQGAEFCFSQAHFPARRPPGALKTVSQQGPQAPSSAALLPQRERLQGKGQDGTRGQKGSPRNRSLASDSSRFRRLKVALLPHRRGEPLRLPSPPHLSLCVPAKHLHEEKEAVLQSINDALRGETEAISGCCAPEPQCSSLLPAASTAPVTIASTPPSTSVPVPSAFGAGPSTSTSPDCLNEEVSPIVTTPPICAQLSGARPGSNGGNQAAPAPAQAPTSAPGQTALGNTPQVPVGALLSTTSPLSTHASTRTGLPATPSVVLSSSATSSSGEALGRKTRKRKGTAIETSTEGPSTRSGPATLSSGGSSCKKVKKHKGSAILTSTEGPSTPSVSATPSSGEVLGRKTKALGRKFWAGIRMP